jgi:hypothetical protein
VSTWHYERGQWTETTFLDDAWGEAQPFDTMIRNRGYAWHLHLGETHDVAISVTVYQRDDPPRYLIDIGDHVSTTEVVTAATLPDALDLFARYAPIVTASHVSIVGCDIRDLAEDGTVTDVLAAIHANRGAAEQRAERERRARSAP